MIIWFRFLWVSWFIISVVLYLTVLFPVIYWIFTGEDFRYNTVDEYL